MEVKNWIAGGYEPRKPTIWKGKQEKPWRTIPLKVSWRRKFQFQKWLSNMWYSHHTVVLFFSCFERFKTSSILLTTICSKIWYPLLVYKHTYKQNTIYIINLSSQRYLPYISDGIQWFWDSYGFTRECFGFTWLSLCFSLLALALHEYLTFYKYYSEIRWYIIVLLYSIGCLYVQMDSTLPPKWVHWLLVS